MLDSGEVKAAFINRLTAHRFPFENVYGILGSQYYGLSPQGKVYFMMDPLDMMGSSATVMYPMLQIAYYMGFQTVLIVGMDGRYDTNSEYLHFYSNEDLPSCWSKTIGSRISEEQLYEESDYSLAVARQVYEAGGRRIINLSNPTYVEVLEKGELKDWE
jgi:hypothetical protein